MCTTVRHCDTRVESAVLYLLRHLQFTDDPKAERRMVMQSGDHSGRAFYGV